jgi:hypothetical protein
LRSDFAARSSVAIARCRGSIMRMHPQVTGY